MSYAAIIVSAFLSAAQALPGGETRSWQLCGFGLVVGLPGTGGRGVFTRDFAASLLESQWGVPRSLATRIATVLEGTGVASAVMVTAEVRSNVYLGTRGAVTISPLDDAGSVKGGILMTTPLRASDGKEYAIARGMISVGKSGIGRIPAGSRVIQRVRNTSR